MNITKIGRSPGGHIELANRYMAIDALVNHYDATEVESINPQMVTYIQVNKNGTWVDIPEIDYQYCLFQAATAEFTHIMTELAARDQAKLDKLSVEQITYGNTDEVIPSLRTNPKENTRLLELIASAKETLRRKALRDAQQKDIDQQQVNETSGTIIDKPKLEIVR